MRTGREEIMAPYKPTTFIVDFQSAGSDDHVANGEGHDLWLTRTRLGFKLRIEFVIKFWSGLVKSDAWCSKSDSNSCSHGIRIFSFVWDNMNGKQIEYIKALWTILYMLVFSSFLSLLPVMHGIECRKDQVL